MTSEGELSRDELEWVSRRTLDFEEYVLRRAWGVFYATWAAAYLAYVGLPYLLSGLPNAFAWLAYALGYGVVSLSVGMLTGRIFFTAGRTLRLRRSLEPESWRRGFGLRFIAVFVIFFASAGLSVYFFGARGISLYFVVLLVYDVYLFHLLKSSFGKLSIDGLVATISYGAGALASSAAAALGLWDYVTTAWVVTAACWLFSSVYALYHAPEVYAGGSLMVERD